MIFENIILPTQIRYKNFYNRWENHGSCRGFTLVELLVVLAVVSLLMSILLPALRRARAKGREIVCAANLRTWGNAFYIYANDNDHTLPHTDDRARNRPEDVYSPDHPEHECCYIDLLPPLMGRHPWRDFPEGSKPTGDIWQCPVAKPLPDSAYSPRYKPSLKGYHSYAMNSSSSTISISDSLQV